ncbi:MAG TPA: hypothetical protein VM890_14035 [Longimicrobium sp.]|jgi:hypothetical protein|nr:hypothetical protein [Longimicrobium sp.]
MKAALLLCLAAGLGACADAAGAVLRTGASAPVAVVSAGRPTILWVVRDADVLACRTPAREMRALQAAYGDRFGIAVVAVGDRPRLVPAFIREERLAAELVPVSERVYRERFGRVVLPAVVVVKGGRVVGVWDGSRATSEAVRTGRRVHAADVLRQLLDGSGAVAGAYPAQEKRSR